MNDVKTLRWLTDDICQTMGSAYNQIACVLTDFGKISMSAVFSIDPLSESPIPVDTGWGWDTPWSGQVYHMADVWGQNTYRQFAVNL